MSRLLCAVLLLLPACTASDGHNGAANHGSVITTWNKLALDACRTEELGAAGASRLYAMVNVAMYDAVNGIDTADRGHHHTRAHALVPATGAPAHANRAAAAAAAAEAVLSGLFPDLAATYATQLVLEAPKHNEPGAAWGRSVGQQVVALRADDGSSPGETQPAGTAPGEFTSPFTSAQYRNMRPFAIADKGPYTSEGPPTLTSREYAAAHTEVRLLGDAAYVNQNYDEIFRFWAGGSRTVRPPGEWVKIAVVVAEERGTVRDISETARLFALLGMALADSTIATWNSKFLFHAWRPRTAVQNAGLDGNPDTVEDAMWEPRNGGKGSSPEHTSGQSTYAGSGSTVLAGFYGDNNVAFTFTGDNAVAGPRTFASFSDAAHEAGRARIYAGIHFEFSNEAGQVAGRAIGREVLSNALQLVHQQ